MPAPSWLARFNRRATNRVARLYAPHLPWFGVVVHRGRTTGRQYRTPVNVFWQNNTVTIALTYGRDSQWVRNVVANGACLLVTRGRTYELAEPRIFRDETRQRVPWIVRQVLRMVSADDFLEMTAV